MPEVSKDANSDGAPIGAKVGSRVVRILVTTITAGTCGAIINFLVELFLRPDLYAAGDPLSRGLMAFGMTSPVILLGLIILGLPISYLLKHLKIENAFSYVLAGALSGMTCGIAMAYPYYRMEWVALTAAFGAGTAVVWWWLKPLEIYLRSSPSRT